MQCAGMHVMHAATCITLTEHHVAVHRIAAHSGAVITEMHSYHPAIVWGSLHTWRVATFQKNAPVLKTQGKTLLDVFSAYARTRIYEKNRESIENHCARANKYVPFFHLAVSSRYQLRNHPMFLICNDKHHGICSISVQNKIQQNRFFIFSGYLMRVIPPRARARACMVASSAHLETVALFFTIQVYTAICCTWIESPQTRQTA